jgi:two-component system, chemotaxis family, sensor kinase CheA
MIVRDELLEQFLVEGRELLDRAAADLAALGRDAADADALDGLFRTMHTLKGSAALFDVPELTQLLHALESRLEAARADGALPAADRPRLERGLDIADLWLEALDRDGAPSDHLRQETVGLERGGHVRATASPTGAGSADWARELASTAGAIGALVAIRYAPAPEAYFRGDDPLAVMRGVPGLLHLAIDAPAGGADYDPFSCTLTLRGLSSAPITDVRAAVRLVADQVEVVTLEVVPAATPRRAGLALRSLRVDADRLDDVAALIDELVIAKNALVHQTALLAAVAGEQARSRELANSLASVERVVADLHASVTRLRLVTLGHVFNRLPRQVREIAEALGKDVELVVSGEAVAVDKSVVEHLYEPLLHLVRNAIDHGIEPAGVRRERGKRERGVLTLTAQMARDEVTIDLADDGDGIDAARVRQLAVGRGLIDADSAAELSDAAAANLVFAPGFTTATEVTQLSGRGVGMDAVRAAVIQVGGRVGLENRPGQGLSVRLTLPAHVVLTKLLVVKAGGERFGVPLESVRETHRVRRDDITPVRAGRAYVRRDNVIPLLRLSDLLGVGRREDAGAFPVLRIQAGGEDVGIQIDEIAERVEAPLRPMAGVLASFPGVLGTVLQGDGEVLLVLDLAELAA